MVREKPRRLHLKRELTLALPKEEGPEDPSEDCESESALKSVKINEISLIDLQDSTWTAS